MLKNSNTIIFLAVVIWMVCNVFPAHAQSKTAGQFVRIGDDLTVTLVGKPAISFKGSHVIVPGSKDFEEYENSIPVLNPKINNSPNWVRIILNNNSGSTAKLVVRYGSHPTDMHVIYTDSSSNVVRKQAGILVKATDKFPSAIHASHIEVRPGMDTLYFYNADTWKKFTVTGFEFVNPKFVQGGNMYLHTSGSTFPFVLFAFIMLLVFQVLYLVIQAFYHRKIEYREYIFYLLSVLIYFIIRYELFFNVSIITLGMPELRRLLNDLMLFVPFAFYLRFSRHFLEMKEKFPDMNWKVRVVERMVFILAIIFLVMYFTDWKIYENIYSTIVIIVLTLYTFRLIWFFYNQHNKQIMFILAGSLAATTGHICAMSISWSPFLYTLLDTEPVYFTMVGLIFEIFFFNTGLGYKSKSEQWEKVKTQEKLIQQLNANRRMQLRLETMRNKIASDLHDDVGSTLSSIGLYSEVAIDQLEKNPVYVKSILVKISSSSHRMMTAINDIVWAIYSRHDEGEGLVERIKYFADERLAPTGINFKLDYEKQVEQLRLSMEARRNILLIFKEAINNAAKYSGSDRITCSLSIYDNWLECRITDFGTGILDPVIQFGNGLANMKKRATEMRGKLEVIPGQESGTTIVAIIPLDEILLYSLDSNK